MGVSVVWATIGTVGLADFAAEIMLYTLAFALISIGLVRTLLEG